MSNIQHIKNHTFVQTDKLFLDANIWLSVYGPIAWRRKKSAIYSQAFSDILNAKSSIFIDVLVLSEFINAFARWEHRQSTSRRMDFKDFRKTSAFSNIAKEIVNNAKRIIRRCQRCHSNFMDIDIEELLSKFKDGGFDFNDQVFFEICKRNECVLITDDADFKCESLNILTANQRLLNS